jgi:putative endonuclease
VCASIYEHLCIVRAAGFEYAVDILWLRSSRDTRPYKTVCSGGEQEFDMYYVYVIKSAVNGNLYKGYTKNLEQRVDQHNRGRTKSTKAFVPWTLIYFEQFVDANEARIREKYFKTAAGRRFLKKVVSNHK